MPEMVSMDALRGMFREEASAAVADALKNNTPAGGTIKDLVDAIKGSGVSNDKPLKQERVFGRAVRSLINASFDPDRALKDVKAGKYGKDSNMIDAVERVMSAGEATAGGFWLPPEFSTEVIGLLESKAVVRKANPQRADLDKGTLTIPKITEGSQAHYVGENETALISQVGAGNVTMVARKLMTRVAMSNDLMRYSNDAADLIVRNDIVRAMRVREDRAFLRGTGSEHSPRGLRNWALPGNITASNGTDLTDIQQDLVELVGALEDADCTMDNCWFFMHPRTKNHLLWNVMDGLGHRVFKEEIAAGKLAGYNLAVTTSIPKNLGGGTDSEIIFADMADMILGDATGLMIAASDSAAYEDEEGNLTSAFDNDQIIIRAISLHDFISRRDVSIAVKTGVAYGAAA